MQIKRYETKSGKLNRRIMAFGEYDEIERKYERYITFDYMVCDDRVAVCLGFSKHGIPDLMNQYESYAKEVFARLLNAGVCLNFSDIDFHILLYGMFNNKVEINRVIFEDFEIVNWHGKNTLFYI